MTIETILAERGASYGEYADGTDIAMCLFGIVQNCVKYDEMTNPEQYAMFMFCAKMARLLNGDPHHVDSWNDIAGYATCVVNTLTGDEK